MDSEEEYILPTVTEKQKRSNKKKKNSKKTKKEESDSEEIRLIEPIMSTPKKKKRGKSSSPSPTKTEPDPSPIAAVKLPSKAKKQTANIKKQPNNTDPIQEDGMNIIMAMSADDMEELLSRIDTQCPVDDIKRLPNREELIDWEKVSFSCYGPRQCQTAWLYIRNKARKHRIMHEIVEEMMVNFKGDYHKFKKKMIESAPDFPQKPYAIGAFQLFCKERWDKYKAVQEKMNAKVENFLNFQTKCYEKWGVLNGDIKEDYDVKAKVIAAEYKRKVKEYFAKFPGFPGPRPKLNKEGKSEKELTLTKAMKKQALKLSQDLYHDSPQTPLNPQKLFINSKLNRLDPPPTEDELGDLKLHYLEKWKKLSNGKKLKWIENCIRKCETYMEEIREYKKSRPMYFLPKELRMSSLINKEEFSIWSDAHGKPPKPKNSIFEVFLDEFSKSESELESEEEIRKAAQAKWDDLDWYHKEMYKMQFKMQQMTFKRDIEMYFGQLPEIIKPVALGEIPKKFHKALLDDVDKDPLILIDEAPKPIQGSSGEGKPDKKRKGVTDDEETADGESQEDGNEGSPKKKKKKKKKKSDDDTLPLYMVELTDEHKTMIQEKIQEEKEVTMNAAVARGKKYNMKIKTTLASNDVESIGEAIVEKCLKKPNPSSYPPGTSITPRKKKK